MNDRELLEFSAKAAGIEYRSAGYRVMGIGETGMPLLAIWNPLDDDGDALRLAVKLRLVVHHEFNMGEWRAEAYGLPDDDGRSICQAVPHCNDASAATRLAITYVAAEIGKAQQ